MNHLFLRVLVLHNLGFYALIGSVFAFILLFFVLYHQTGDSSSAAVSALPVIVASWFYGKRAGVITAIATTVLFLALLVGVEEIAFQEIFMKGGISGGIALLFIGAVVGQLRDLTDKLKQELVERQKLDVMLRASEERYRRLTENAVDVIYRYRFTPTRGFEYVSPAASIITGYTPEEYYADPELVFKVVHPEDRELLEQADAEENIRQPLALRWVKKDGQMVWTEQRNVPIYDEGGNLIGLEGIARDITQRKQIEEALRESEERYRALYNQIDDAIFIHDGESNIIDVNHAACDRLGYRRDELLSMKTIDIDAPDYASRFQQRFERQLTTGKLHDIAGTHVTRDGRQIPVQVNSRMIIFKGQVAVLAVARDVTALKQAEQHTLALAAEREQVKMLTDFVRDISHDFRTPLATISTTAYLLLRNPDPDRRQQYFETLEEQVKLVNQRIERLLTMARLDGGGGEFDLRTVRVATLLQQIQERFFSIAQEKEIQLVVDFPDAALVINAHEQEMTNALGEIVDNALVFTPAGGKVTLRANVEEELMVITVQDTGQGIQPVDLPHIFKRLYRADTARSGERGSAGLGLSIAQKIVEVHHGRIEVSSEVGEGSIFRVVLSLAH